MLGQRQEEGDEEIVNRFLGDYFSLIKTKILSILTLAPPPLKLSPKQTSRASFF